MAAASQRPSRSRARWRGHIHDAAICSAGRSRCWRSTRETFSLCSPAGPGSARAPSDVLKQLCRTLCRSDRLPSLMFAVRRTQCQRCKHYVLNINIRTCSLLDISVDLGNPCVLESAGLTDESKTEMSKHIHVVPHEAGWATAAKVHRGWGPPITPKPRQRRRRAAPRFACTASFIIHRPGGRIRDANSYGNEPFPPKG